MSRTRKDLDKCISKKIARAKGCKKAYRVLSNAKYRAQESMWINRILLLNDTDLDLVAIAPVRESYARKIT